MKTFEELRNLAKDYISNIKKKDSILYEPVFRKQNNKLYLEYLVVNFDQDYKLKKPQEWLLQDISTGEIIGYYNTNEINYTDEEVPLLFENDGKSILYDELNYIIKRFQIWQKDTLKELNDLPLNNLSLSSSKVIEIDDEVISPKDYILANIDSTFENMLNQLIDGLGDNISKGFSEYTASLFNKVREDYLNNHNINTDFIREYLNAVKYAWPESIELFNCCSNIKESIDNDFDKKIKEMLGSKK